MRLELALVGSAGDVSAEIVGAGSIDPDAGKLALEVRTTRRLLLFDPAFIAIDLLDVLVLAATQTDPADPEATCT